MKRILFLCAVLLTVLYNGNLNAQEIELAAGGSNMVFDQERKKPLGDEEENFSSSFSFLGHISMKDEITDIIGYSVSIEKDQILQNRLGGLMAVSMDYMNLEFGPVMGVFNTYQQPLNIGIQGGVQLAYPGIIFCAFKGSSTIGSQNGITGDNSQITGEVNLGFWLPNVIPVLSISTRSFTKQSDDDLLVRDELTRYQFSADVFSKNVPFTVRIDMGYENLKRSYKYENSSSETDELKALYLGFEGRWRVYAPLSLFFNIEMPVFSWAVRPMKNPDREKTLYRFFAGASWTFL